MNLLCNNYDLGKECPWEFWTSDPNYGPVTIKKNKEALAKGACVVKFLFLEIFKMGLNKHSSKVILVHLSCLSVVGTLDVLLTPSSLIWVSHYI